MAGPPTMAVPGTDVATLRVSKSEGKVGFQEGIQEGIVPSFKHFLPPLFHCLVLSCPFPAAWDNRSASPLRSPASGVLSLADNHTTEAAHMCF